MDSVARDKLLNGVELHFRTFYESAQEHFPAALIKLSEGAKVKSLREIADIKPDLQAAMRNIAGADVGELLKQVNEDSPYPLRRLKKRHLLYRDVPDKLLVARENLRRTGYVIMGHAQEARRYDNHGFEGHVARALMGDRAFYRTSNYMMHLQQVFDNARAISHVQAGSLGYETPYDANLEDFTPGVRVSTYISMIDQIFEHALSVRAKALKAQSKAKAPLPLPEFSLEQGQRLVDLICDLLPIPDKTYQTRLLARIPSMCMGNIATIKFSTNPLVLLETAFHERLGHLTYRYNASHAGGIAGFHLDEARALSLERFFLREYEVLEQISELFIAAYDGAHEAFSGENLYRLTHHVNPDISERTSSDDLTYILQEIIRGRTEMMVMNGDITVKDMPEFMAAETGAAFGLEGLNGYHIMRETFQWPLCMQGHLAAYPTGIVLAAQVHKAAKRKLGPDFSSLSDGANSPYFNFMESHIDANGAEIAPEDIIRKATGRDFLDPGSYLDSLEAKKMASTEVVRDAN